MAKSRKTWREKLETARQAEIVDDRRGRGRLLIPRPLDVDALMRQVPWGKLATVEQIRQRLARDRGADLTCPLTTGIFIHIAAEVAEEDMSAGREDATAYWRVIRADGSLNEKLPGGTGAQAARLREEGHGIEPGKGKRPPRVKDFERSLHEL